MIKSFMNNNSSRSILYSLKTTPFSLKKAASVTTLALLSLFEGFHIQWFSSDHSEDLLYAQFCVLYFFNFEYLQFHCVVGIEQRSFSAIHFGLSNTYSSVAVVFILFCPHHPYSSGAEYYLLVYNRLVQKGKYYTTYFCELRNKKAYKSMKIASV